jgi:hypothetical protein
MIHTEMHQQLHNDMPYAYLISPTIAAWWEISPARVRGNWHDGEVVIRAGSHGR